MQDCSWRNCLCLTTAHVPHDILAVLLSSASMMEVMQSCTEPCIYETFQVKWLTGAMSPSIFFLLRISISDHFCLHRVCVAMKNLSNTINVNNNGLNKLQISYDAPLPDTSHHHSKFFYKIIPVKYRNYHKNTCCKYQQYIVVLNKKPSLFRLHLETVNDLFSFSVWRASCEQGPVWPHRNHCGKGT